MDSRLHSTSDVENAKSKRAAAVAVLAANITLQTSLVTAIVSGPTMESLLRLSKMELGTILGAANIGIVVISPFAGYSTQRWGISRIFTAGLCLGLASVGILLSAGNFPGLLIGMAILGLSAALVSPTSCTLLSNLSGSEVKRIMYLASALWLGSSALAAPLIGHWVELTLSRQWEAWSYRSVFLMDFVLLIACVGLAFWALSPVIDGRRSVNASEPRTVEYGTARLGAGWQVVPFLGICHGLMFYCVLAWSGPMVQQKFGVSGFKGSLIVGIVCAGLAIGRLALGIYNLRVDERTVLSVSGFLGGLSLMLALFSPTFPLTMVLMGIGGLMCSATYPCILSLVSTRFPRAKAILYGYTEASVAMAGFLGPIIVATLAERALPLWWALLISPVAALTLGALSYSWKTLES